MKFQTSLKILNNSIILTKPKWVKLEDGEFEVEIRNPEESKTTRQRNYFFALVKDIARAQDGNAQNYMNWYGILLKTAGIRVTGIRIKKVALNALKSICKYMVIIGESDEWATVDIYKGVSEMDKKEMRELIDVTLDFAAKVGAKTDAYYQLQEEYGTK